VEDVAAVHLKTLDLKVPGNERYMFYAGLFSPAGVANKVREVYPELRSRVPAGPTQGGVPPGLVQYDCSKFEKAYGKLSWKGWWEATQGTIEDILRYEKATGKN
jgi:hypothetical protein